MTQNICWWRGNFLIRRLNHPPASASLPAAAASPADWPRSSDWPLRLAQISRSIIYYAPPGSHSSLRWNLSRNQQIICDGRSIPQNTNRLACAVYFGISLGQSLSAQDTFLFPDLCSRPYITTPTAFFSTRLFYSLGFVARIGNKIYPDLDIHMEFD